MSALGVVIVTHGLLPVMLRMTLTAWRAVVPDAKIVVVLPQEKRSIAEPFGCEIAQHDTHYKRYGDAMHHGLSKLPPEMYAVIGADDILPLASERPWRPTLEPLTIRCIPMTWLGAQSGGAALADVQKFGWLRIERDAGGAPHSRPQDPAEHATESYVAGGSQLLSPEARHRISYQGLSYHSFDDFRVCQDAERRGIKLVSFGPDDPLLVHMDGGPHAKWGGAP